jgi:hypothetical protein
MLNPREGANFNRQKIISGVWTIAQGKVPFVEALQAWQATVQAP